LFHEINETQILNILHYILYFIIVGLLITESSSPIKQNRGENLHGSIICTFYSNLDYVLKSSNNNFDLTNLNYSYLEFDQDDNDNSNHNKYLSICILYSEKSKILPLREKEFIPKKSLSYFELDLPPPLIS
jgi:hypothetical protein